MFMEILIRNIWTLIAPWLVFSLWTDGSEKNYGCLPAFLALSVKLKLTESCKNKASIKLQNIAL